jgi:hypothetical protein
MNPRKIANKLEELAEKVSQRGVYLSVRDQDTYAIVEYLTENVVIRQIPHKALAERMATSMNSQKTLHAGKIKKAQDSIKLYHKYHSDAGFYQQTLRASSDEFKKQVTRTRLVIALQWLDKLTKTLENL